VSRPLCGAYLGRIPPRPFSSSSSSPARQFLYFSAIKEREDPSVLCCTGIYVGIFISHMYTAARPESSAVKKTTPGFMGHHHHKYLGLFFFFFFFLDLYISAVIGHSKWKMM
jgi:hypothetical protein